MLFNGKILRRIAYSSASLLAIQSIPSESLAQDAKVYTNSLNAPVFQRIDQNGVDLVTGQFRVSSPTLEWGSEHARVTLGLQWTGQGWVYLDQPTIWRKDDIYTVVYQERSTEFNGRSSNFSQRKPIDGSKLSCSIFMPGNHASECQYTDRSGDVVHFRGMIPPFAGYAPDFGYSALRFGNMGISEAALYSADNAASSIPGVRYWGVAGIMFLADNNYHKRLYTLALGPQKLIITTQNHDGTDWDEHYLRPKGTTQSFTDDSGASWTYTFNNNREMTRVATPGAAADVVITYTSGNKVSTVTTADGVWQYTYPFSFGNIGETFVKNPLNETTYVKYHKDHGYVLEFRDALNRTTYYSYDSGHRLQKVTFPEGNYQQFTYDGRGNILTRTIAPKPGSGEAPIIESATYPATCANAITCNLPTSVTDANGAVTDLEYAVPGTQEINSFAGPTGFPAVAFGTTKPVKVTSAAPSVGAPRPQTLNSYENGMLVRSVECRTISPCSGTSDEIVTEYDYAGTSGTTRLLHGKTVTADGQTLRICYGYDTQTRLVSETPPIAAMTACPSTRASTLPTNAFVPVAANPATAPTYPDGTTGGAPILPPGGGGEEPPEPCGLPGGPVIICDI